MTMATSNALLGFHNPMRDNPRLMDALWWDYLSKLLTFAYGQQGL